jgi:hypothetical protein
VSLSFLIKIDFAIFKDRLFFILPRIKIETKMAPVKYFGKPTYQQGKLIWDILGNLRNFGIGRFLVRSPELLHYPNEMCFYRVASVSPAMDEVITKNHAHQ